jgi:hypothetical protein
MFPEGAKWNAVQAAPDTSGTWSLIGFTTPEAGSPSQRLLAL